MKRMMTRSMALLLAAAMLLSMAGCTVSADSVETTAATEAPGLFDPNADGSTPIARVGELTLTGGVLQILYRLEAAKAPGEAREVLDRALDRWQLLAALDQQSRQYVERVEKDFHVDKKLHAEYMDPCMEVSPAAEFLYDDDATFAPNTMHRAYLEAIPEQLETLAGNQGFGSTDEMVKATLGAQSTGEDLIGAVTLLNRDYAYYTELSYDLVPTEEEIEAWFTAHEQEYAAEGLTRDSGYTLDLRNLMMVPEGAAVAEDGTVTATDKQWAVCEQKLSTEFYRWRKHPYRDPGFGIEAHDRSADAVSAPVGGLYSNVEPGQLPEPLDSWCFGEPRAAGDYARLRSDYGWHILYIKAVNPLWHTRARADLLEQMAADRVTEIRKAWPMDILEEDIRLSPEPEKAFPLGLEALLYPDVAHERFPEVPIFIQQDYRNAPFGAYHVGHHGCGITSFAMLATYMSDQLLTPGAMAEKYGRYSVKDGSDFMLFYYPPAEYNFYVEGFGGFLDQVLEALAQGKMVVNVQVEGYFTRAAHFMVLSDVDEEGLITIRDSNIYNYKRLPEHRDDKFDPRLLLPAATMFWIFDKKITRSPICVRCAEEEYEGTRILQGEYLCPRCREALLRREGFLGLFS